jgi:hypothetical protein
MVTKRAEKATTWNVEHESWAKIAVLQLSLSSGVLKIARCRILWREIRVELAEQKSGGSGTIKVGQTLDEKNGQVGGKV